MGLLRDFWLKNLQPLRGGVPHCAPVKCADGFTMSVQASQYHYCAPRQDDANGDYRLWEVGLPSARDERLMPYIDGGEETNTVYGYVPTEVIESIIADHGGLREEVA